MWMGTRICHRTSQIPSSKLLKMKNDHNEWKKCQRHHCFHHFCIESPMVKLLTQSASRMLRPSPWWFLCQKVWIVIPGLVSIQGLCCNPCHHFSPGLQKGLKAERWSATHSIHQIASQQTCFCVKEQSQSWLAYCCPRKSSPAGMESCKSLPKTRPLPPLGNRWTAAKSLSESTGLGQKSTEIITFLKCFVKKLFCPVYLFLITPGT